MKKTLSLVMILLMIFQMSLTLTMDTEASISILELEQVTNNAWDDFCPVIDVDSAGNPHIAWTTPELGYYAYKSGGSWIIKPIPTDPPMSGGGWNWISLRLDSQDRPHIAWALPTPDPEIFYSYWDGDEWTTEQVTDWDASEGSEVALALDSNDKPHIVWDSRYRGTWGIFYSKKTDSGWIPFESISHNDDSHPSIAIDKNDIPHVSWNRDYRVAGGGVWHASRVEGTWTTEQIMASPAEGSTSGQHIVIDSLGNPYVVFAKREVPYQPEKYHIMYAHKSAGSWDIHEVFDGIYQNKWACIALSADNMPYLAWSSDATGVFDIYLAEYEQQWIVYDMSNQPLEEHRPNVVVDSRGNVHVVWYGPQRGQGTAEIYYSKISVMVAASVDIDPDTLNLKSNGEWITAYVTLPEDFSVVDIDVMTVELNHNDFALSADWGEVQDSVLMVKFDRATLRDYLGEVDVDEGNKFYDITLTVKGSVAETLFEGTDTITVKRK